ncbi:DUF1553 domain-containing protein [Stieleria sp. TO1_6]|uniref:DUF1553 domain-containing protein n=1 Tax=Stieleria tagensis TaxID=2956795 RepID=UPI00209B4D2C|nr:DUF1553 domain-containing protein [Stieleria tagensis]MCO8120792.1 DUF1553 domain-containing protein [Stieleria tagensis]
MRRRARLTPIGQTQSGRTSPFATPWRLRQLASGMLLLLAAGWTAPRVDAADPSYNRDIRPILADLCFACHGTDAESRAADLRLDQRDAAIEGAAIVPGDPEASEMIARIQSDDPEVVMPPPHSKKVVSPQQRETLNRWIASGAEYQRHWSLVPATIQSPAPVANQDWRKNPIDDYVAAKLASIDLQPAAEAEPDVLFRRLHLDVTGLPPSPADREAFVSDYARDGEPAYLQWIDRLMDRPTWGEHRGRYWLDAARYGDTHGLHFDNYREMWPYRDWVIKAFNRNQPFDRFIIEQIAGDLLDSPTESQLIATGFQRCNITTNEGGTIDEENLANYAADRVQTFGWVFLGLTTNCAQCHDHKFDPITQKDYYSLAAFFGNTTQRAKDGNRADGLGPILAVPTDADRPRWEALPQEIAAAIAARDGYPDTAKASIDAWAAAVDLNELDQLVPTAGLVAHLPLDEGHGNDLRSDGQLDVTFHLDHKLVWKSSADHAPTPVIQDGQPIELGPIGNVAPGTAFSFSAWINAPESGGESFIAKMAAGPGHRGWDLFRQGNALAVHLVDHWPDNALKATTEKQVLKPGHWQHVAVTYDGSGKTAGITIYLDGIPQSLTTQTETLQPGATLVNDVALQLGARDTGKAMVGMGIGDFRFYRRKLSSSDVGRLLHVQEIRRLITARDAGSKWSAKDRKQVDQFYLVAVDDHYYTLVQSVQTLQQEREAIEARSPITHIQRERMDSPATAHILMRGQYDQPGDQVAAATPAALHPMDPRDPKNRLGLARWLVDPANPLTMRVTVNRFWQQVFGRGLVPTSEDFGVTGMLPSNPELLDYLAVDFQQHGYDVKRFFKRLFQSAAYRQAAITTPEKLLGDRDNALLSRGPRFRMDAEMVRDQALAASGLLSHQMYGPGVRPYQPTDIWNIVGLPGSDTREYKQDDGEGLYRRTLYSFWKRMAPPPNMDALNAPSREVCVVRRERTNTPLQALVTLNDPQFVEAARFLAQSVLAETPESGSTDRDLRIATTIARRVLCREINAVETEILLTSLGEFRNHYLAHPDDAEQLIAVGQSDRPKSIDAAQLAAWTLVCNQIMNLDEVVCK